MTGSEFVCIRVCVCVFDWVLLFVHAILVHYYYIKNGGLALKGYPTTRLLAKG